MSVRTRFAPSPTGSLHVGGVRTALYCLLFARKHAGTFLVRVEDTDQARSTDEAAAGILRDLQWCGLQWDEGPGCDQGHGPYFQSQRLEIYNQYVEQLLASGHAYEAWETRDELDEMRKQAEARKQSLRYKRRPYGPAEITRFHAEGRTPVIRLESPRHDIVVHDRILGDVTIGEADLEDIVIRKADGFPTYHFAVVIDDTLMEITQVLRGQEHLMNTPKHLGIYEALSWEPPAYGHMPLIFNPTGSKMSKRDKAKAARDAARHAQDQRRAGGGDPKDWSWLAEATGLGVEEIASFMRKEHDRIPVAEAIAAELGIELPLIEVMDFRRGGYLPEALINYMALLGWNPGDEREIMSLEEMTEAFDLSRVRHTPARFDLDKLRWMNSEYIRKLSDERLLEVTRQYLEVVHTPLHAATDEQLVALYSMYRDRISTLSELDQMARFFFVRPADYDAKAAQKHLVKGGGLDRLVAAREALATVASWDATAIEAALTAAAGEAGLGKIAQPLRIALTGTAVSPPIFETIAYFERDEAIARIDACVGAFAGRL